MPKPSPNGASGRTRKGQFARGNPGGPGNPNAARVAALRSALFAAVGPAELRAVVKALLRKARKGDVLACREVLNRTLGAGGEPADLLARVEKLEDALAARRGKE